MRNARWISYIQQRRRRGSTASSVENDTSSLPCITYINHLISKHLNNECYRDERLRPVKYLNVPRRSAFINSQLLVLVVVKWDDFSSRAQWRHTYASRENRIRYGYDVIFTVGADKDVDVQSKIDAENELEGDILQADFVDSYRNLTLKMLSAFRYIAVALDTASIIMKIDADVGWRIKNLTEYQLAILSPCLLFHKVTKNFLMGSLYDALTTNGMCRTKNTHTTPSHHFALNVHQQRFLWLEDVFITGILANNNEVTIINIGHDKYFRATTSMENFDIAWLFHITRRNLSVVELYRVLNNIF
ncbi:unnamed protein product [Cylicocyclus nassatus]|uniref:Hexosyltransferase n=1 Tax=Cylicocyclus nassatus TaxID=53992 RepID=A0AA36MCM5_CYLNA|nr:unnamed protein product [Cylicocyclus nassatus]